MKTLLMQMVLAMMIAASLLLASAQSPPIDPALLAKANAGDAPAQVEIGDRYLRAGSAAEQDPNRRVAAALSTSDYKLAADWFRKAAALGSVAAQLHLAQLYRDGKGVARDLAQAAAWFRKAAEQGDVDAQASLGVLYSIGMGVPHNDSEAYFWLDLAASVKGPNQDKYAANRQLVGTHITAGELDEVQDRVAAWIAAHPRPAASE